MIVEIQKWIASTLLVWVLRILPNGKFKYAYIIFVRDNIEKL